MLLTSAEPFEVKAAYRNKRNLGGHQDVGYLKGVIETNRGRRARGVSVGQKAGLSQCVHVRGKEGRFLHER